MITAISCSGNSMDSQVDTRFGRCPFFAIFDSESGKLRFEENPGKEAESGAGPAAVKFIASQGAQKIVSGEFGFKVKPLFDQLDIQMISIEGNKTVREIMELLKSN
ncbi:MAG: hypothetical protein LKI53_06820 [Bacteroidales bacterium]|jgi:predicted Fe-Mo cluster-binding NifX family protein|nr:hypothetical protein [Bacteroidales bacterium]